MNAIPAQALNAPAMASPPRERSPRRPSAEPTTAALIGFNNDIDCQSLNDAFPPVQLFQHDDNISTSVAFGSTAAIEVTHQTANPAANISLSGDELSQWMETLLDASNISSEMTGQLDDISPIQTARLDGRYHNFAGTDAQVRDHFDQLILDGNSPGLVESMKRSIEEPTPRVNFMPNVAACSARYPPPPPTRSLSPVRPTIDLTGARDNHIPFGKVNSDNLRSFKRMESTSGPFPTKAHSPNKDELQAQCDSLQAQIADLRQENGRPRETSKEIVQYRFVDD